MVVVLERDSATIAGDAASSDMTSAQLRAAPVREANSISTRAPIIQNSENDFLTLLMSFFMAIVLRKICLPGFCSLRWSSVVPNYNTNSLNCNPPCVEK